MTNQKRQVYTIGHSTRTFAEFVEILKSYNVKCLVDVRTVPKSRHYPHFNKDFLEKELPLNGIEYSHMAGLGGWRRSRMGSLNKGWRNAAFRGYADYMQTREFVRNLQPLIKLAKIKTVAFMCAEAVPWRCHRSLIADALIVRKFKVLDLYNNKSVRAHSLTSWARVKGTMLTYPSDEEKMTTIRRIHHFT